MWHIRLPGARLIYGVLPAGHVRLTGLLAWVDARGVVRQLRMDCTGKGSERSLGLTQSVRFLDIRTAGEDHRAALLHRPGDARLSCSGTSGPAGTGAPPVGFRA